MDNRRSAPGSPTPLLPIPKPAGWWENSGDLREFPPIPYSEKRAVGYIASVLPWMCICKPIEGDEDPCELDDMWPDLEWAADQYVDELWTVYGPEAKNYRWPTILGTPQQRRILADLCWKYRVIFGPPQFAGSNLPLFDIKLKRNAEGNEMRPKRQKVRPVSPWIRDLIWEDTERKLHNGYVNWGTSEYSSALVAAKQPNKGPHARRIAVDYSEVNTVAEEIKSPVKNQQEVTARLAGSKVFSDLDAEKGFDQLRLTERAKLLLAIVTPHGQLVPETAGFGVHGVPAYSSCV